MANLFQTGIDGWMLLSELLALIILLYLLFKADKKATLRRYDRIIKVSCDMN